MDINEPLITDWINSIAALLGVPLIIWGIIKLFIKDNSQERKIGSLESLAISQNNVTLKMTEEIQELSRQTSEFQYQSELMKESNFLIQKQIELQNEIFLYNKISKEKKLEFQRIERLSKIKPFFVYSGENSNQREFNVKLLNKGETAKNISIIQIDNELAKILPIENFKEYGNNQKLEIKGCADLSRTYYNSRQVPFVLDLMFNDIDGNKYKQTLTRDNNYKITNPKLIEN